MNLNPTIEVELQCDSIGWQRGFISIRGFVCSDLVNIHEKSTVAIHPYFDGNAELQSKTIVIFQTPPKS